MLNTELIKDLIDEKLEGTDKFLTALKLKPGNKLMVFIDGDHGVKIEDCIELNRFLESKLDRDSEDYELLVSSAGADQPLLFERQYRKNKGREIEVLLNDDTKIRGIILDSDPENVEIRVTPEQGTKRKPGVKKDGLVLIRKIPFVSIRETKVVLSFK